MTTFQSRYFRILARAEPFALPFLDSIPVELRLGLARPAAFSHLMEVVR